MKTVWLVVDSDGSELITNEEPRVCMEYCIHSSTKETVLLGKEAIDFSNLSKSEKVAYLLQDLRERPFRDDTITKEAEERLIKEDIYRISELSYKKNRFLRPITLPKGTIEKLLGKVLVFGDEPFFLDEEYLSA